jgi:hypothetical protein
MTTPHEAGPEAREQRDDARLNAQWRRAQDELRAIGDAVAGVTDEVGELFRREADLARTEVSENVALARGGAIFGAVAAVMGLLMLAFLATALMFAIAQALALWAAALITAAVLGVAAFAFGLIARSRLRELRVMPEQTMRSVQEDMRWARERIRQRSA